MKFGLKKANLATLIRATSKNKKWLQIRRQAKFLTSRHVRMHTVSLSLYIPITLRKLMI